MCSKSNPGVVGFRCTLAAFSRQKLEISIIM